MIKLKSICFFALVAVLAVSCNDKELQSLQEEVLQDVFHEFLIGLDIRKMPPPPPPPEMEEPLKIDESFFNDPRKMLVVVNDSVGNSIVHNNIDEIFASNDTKHDSIFFDHGITRKFEYESYGYDKKNVLILPISIYNENKANYQDSYYYGGHLTFSKMIFNPLKTKALIAVSLTCGKLCGSESIFLLVKSEGKWVIQESKLLWLS